MSFLRPLTLCEDPPAQQQQTYASYPSYQQLVEARCHGGQAHGSSYNMASRSTDPRYPPPLDVQGDGRWQGQPYYPSHADLQIPHTSSGLRSPQSVYSPASSLPQYQPHATTACPAEHSLPRGAILTVVPNARVPTSPSPVPHDVPSETADPIIKKRCRKRVDARQLEALNGMYARTAFPSTEERQQLARDLDMSARRVQIWLAHASIYITCIISELSNILSGSRTKGRRATKGDEILPRVPTLQPAGSLQLSLPPSSPPSLFFLSLLFSPLPSWSRAVSEERKLEVPPQEPQPDHAARHRHRTICAATG